jgi:Stress responsive A/B Barrel Domain
MFANAMLACLLLTQPPEPRKPTLESVVDGPLTTSKVASGPMIGHMVFFKLKERTPEAKAKLVAACDKYLEEHDGVAYYSAGVIGDDFKREVNDRDWDVALHLVFKDKAAHDKYQDHPMHLKFIEENKATWDKVRVFDSEIKAKTKK